MYSPTIYFIVFQLLSWNAFAETKIAFIDMQSILHSSSSGKKIMISLKEDYDKKVKILKQKETEIKKRIANFEKKQSILSENAKSEQKIELENDMAQFREELAQHQDAFDKKQRELLQPVLRKASEILSSLAKEKQLVAIFEKSTHSLAWADPQLDLTDEVIKRL